MALLSIRMNDSDLKQLSSAFAGSLPLPPALEPHLGAALRHLLENPGALVRPQIVLRMAAAFGLSEAQANDLAIALEYFHTASLVFDDLPCMDDASHRRGASCVHLNFGEAGAILAALALINRAYALLWKAVAPCSREIQLAALAYAERCLGPEGLLNGQSLDLHYSGLPHDPKTTEKIACEKTVSLIELTLVLPAILGGASGGELRLLKRIARFWGLSYQIVDDLKDVLQSTGASGKTAARDFFLDRPNIALAAGVNGAIARLERLIPLGERAVARLVRSRPAVAFLETLRGDLEREAGRVTQAACLIAESGS